MSYALKGGGRKDRNILLGSMALSKICKPATAGAIFPHEGARYMIRAAVVWLAMAGFYLVLAGDVSAVELVASLVCAGAATGLGIAMSFTAHRQFAGWPSSRALIRPLAALLPETFVVGRQLVASIFACRNQRGAYVRQPFSPGGDDAISAGRRAVVVLGISLAPGSFVIRGDRTETIILHALPNKSPSPDRVWPA